MGCLYRLTFPNGKSYIGITSKTAEQRFAVHFYQRKRQKRPLYQALAKYDRDAVKVETLSTADFPDLYQMEVAAIASYGTKWPCGYNMTDGGESPIGLTEISRDKMSNVHRGNRYRVGKRHTDECRAQMSADRKGKFRRSPEWKAALSKAMMGNTYSLGVKPSVETNAKRAASQICSPAGRGSTSGIKGVSWCSQTRMWRAHATIGRRMKNLGRHKCFGSAVNARKAFVRDYIKGQCA